MYLHVDLIEAKSDLPLYLSVNGIRTKVVTVGTWQVLWKTPFNPTPNGFTAFDVAAGPRVLGIRVTCKFGHEFVGKKDLQLQAHLGGKPAISSPVKVTGIGPISVHEFKFTHEFKGPVAYRGMFRWVLLQGHQPVAKSDSETFLEFYSIFHLSPKWPISGISVNVLRRYLVLFIEVVERSWQRTQFYHDALVKIFGSPFQYDIVSGGAKYAQSGLGGNFRLDQYMMDLDAGQLSIVNCYDMAGIVQLTLQTYPDAASVRWNFLSPCGYINQTILKGRSIAGSCNNPFFGNTYYNPLPLVPVNVTPGLKDRSSFGNHAFIEASTGLGTTVILDATSGPHAGNENLSTYLTHAIDHVTNYYVMRGGRAGTAADINPNHTGVHVTNMASTTSPIHALAEVVGPIDPVDEAMERSKVKDADPPHFTKVDPTGLKSLLERQTKLTTSFTEIIPYRDGVEALWLLNHSADAVEAHVFVGASFDAAVARMRTALTSISAPLGALFVSTLRLGQRTLEAVGGRGLILFVRGNVFVQLVGLASSEELGKGVATAVDHFLKEREGDVKKPTLERPSIPTRHVSLGEVFEIAVGVKDAGYMHVEGGVAIVQLISVDEEHAVFKFHAGGVGKTDLSFVFAHQQTLQTITITIEVEVSEKKAAEEVQKVMSELKI